MAVGYSPRSSIDAARGHSKVVAIIGDSANEPSIALHRKFGFVHVGTLKDVGFKHGRWVDSVDMQLTLAGH